MKELLGIEVPLNRQNYNQQKGEVALVFKLNGRAPEGKILSIAEIKEIGFDFGILKKVLNEEDMTDDVPFVS